MKNSIEIERKFMIRLPEICNMEREADYRSSEITQIYLNSPKGITHRVRKRAYDTHTEYTETKKTRIDYISSTEEEREITEEEFLTLSANIRNGSHPVIKTRHLFSYHGLFVEIDVYPEWQRCAILEVELPTRDTEITLPPFIKIISELTGKREYSNSAMADVFPMEPTI